MSRFCGFRSYVVGRMKNRVKVVNLPLCIFLFGAQISYHRTKIFVLEQETYSVQHSMFVTVCDPLQQLVHQLLEWVCVMSEQKVRGFLDVRGRN